MKRMLASFGAALVAALLSGTGVHADTIPWGYSATTSTPVISGSSPLSQIIITGSSGVANGDSGIIIYSMQSKSSVSSPADTFSSVPFNLAVNLTDIKSTGTPGATSTGTINFSGLFNAKNVTSASLYPLPVGWQSITGSNVPPGVTYVSPTEAWVVLGGNKYDVQISSFTSPGAPNAVDQHGNPVLGAIQAIVTITPGDGASGSGQPPGGGVSGAPEPASLVLAGLGLPLVVLVRRRLKKDAA